MSYVWYAPLATCNRVFSRVRSDSSGVTPMPYSTFTMNKEDIKRENCNQGTSAGRGRHRRRRPCAEDLGNSSARRVRRRLAWYDMNYDR